MKKHYLLTAAFAAFALIFSACSSGGSSSGGGSGSGGSDGDGDTGTVTSVTLDFSTLNLGENDTATLTAIVNGSEDLSDKTVTWATSQASVATVSSTGIVTALAAGTARITATSKADSTKSAYCDVTVESNTTAASTKEEITVGTSPAAYDYSYTGSGATIYIYSQSGGLNFYGIKVGSNLWNPATFTSTTITYSSTTALTSNNVTFTAVLSGSDTMSIDSNSKTIGDTSFTQRFKTGGGGSQTSRCLKISVDSATEFVIYACSSNNSDSRTMIVEVVENNAGTVTIVRPSGIALDQSTASLTRTDDDPSPTVTLTATITNAAEVTSGYDTITWYTTNPSVASVSNGIVTATGAGTAVIKALTVNGHSASCTVTVTSEVTKKIISLSDSPVGYASLGTSYSTTGGTTVTTRAQLLSAVSSGGVIIIDGMIDMSEGKLWTSGSTSMTAGTTAMNTFVSSASTSVSYSTYADWVDKYSAACSTSTEDDKSTTPESGESRSSLFDDLWVLNDAYGNKIKINLNSNTTIIGKDENCGIRGGSIQINGKSNIQIRNLIIQDPCDPFPHHESGDGYNAQWDGICVQGASSNIWIDHCTFEDTLTLAKTTNTTKEKWQIYDGLCDMKGACTNITVSNCIFKNHDKTMLIGSSDSDGDNTKRFVTLAGNYFLNCGQRLPMVRNTLVHVLNNYYVSSGSPYSSQSCVNARKNSIVYAENNYFDSGCTYSFNTASSDSTPVLHLSGNSGSKASSTSLASGVTTDSTLFSTLNKYSYTAVTAAEAKTNATENAGAGYELR